MSQSSRVRLLMVLFQFILTSLSMELYPLGISLGPRQITAAYIARDGKQNTVTSVLGGERYQALIADSIANEGAKIQRYGQWYTRDGESLLPSSPDPPENPEVQELFAAILKEIRREVGGKLTESVDLTSISIPQHFNDTIYVAISEAARELEPGIIRPWQGFGMESSACNIEDGPHLVFFIDYNDTHLELYIADVGEFIFVEVAKKTLKRLGTNKLADMKTVPETYWANVRTEIRDFVDSHFEAHRGDCVVEYLRGIVFSGDAPSRAFQNIREMIVDLFPRQPDTIRDAIDPLYVGAVGAAEWAKLQTQNPKILQDISVDTIIPESHGHDEL